MLVDGKPTSFKTPGEAIRAGFAFTPENRKHDGIIPHLSIRENIVLALQARQGVAKAISRKHQDEIVDKFIKVLGISTPGPEQLVMNLSGGNQQKVLLARWLATQPRLLILDEPTRGIDVGAKAEILKLVQSLGKDGLSVLFISSELEEVVRYCERVVVLRDRAKVGELAGKQISEEAIMHTIAAPQTK
jgi:monosaccharide-transporting ATPase